MSMLLLPNEVLSMTAQAARRLVETGDGDCALLYLALLQGGSSPEQAAQPLGWDSARLNAAFARLVRLGLAVGSPPAASAGTTARRNTPGGTLPTPWNRSTASAACTGRWSGCWARCSPTPT